MIRQGLHCAAHSMHVYEVRPRKDNRGVNLVSDALLFGRLWYGEPDANSNAIDYAKFRSRSHNAVIRIYDEAGTVIETHEHTGDLVTRWQKSFAYGPYRLCWYEVRRPSSK